MELRGDLAPRHAFLAQGFDAGAGNEHSGTTQPLALSASGREAGFHPFEDTNALLLGDCGHHGNYGIAEDSAGVEVLLGEAAIADAVACQPLQMLQCWQNAFPAEPVERPEQQNIELPLGCGVKHCLELLAVENLAGFVIDVVGNNRPAAALLFCWDHVAIRDR
jgi:hypothetical protein